MAEQLGVGAMAPKALSAECIETLCRVDGEVVSMLVVGVVWRSSSRGLTSSSSLERPVFAPPIALTASSLRLWFGGRLVLVEWCCVGFAPVVSVLARFSIN
jgi:hypothetical protein